MYEVKVIVIDVNNSEAASKVEAELASYLNAGYSISNVVACAANYQHLVTWTLLRQPGEVPRERPREP